MYPATVEELTPGFIQELLQKKWPEARVTDMVVIQVIPGTATKVCLEIRVAPEPEPESKSAIPSRFWIKAGLEGHSINNLSLYALETSFYQHLAPELEEVCPVALAAETDKDSGRSMLLLEDLTQRNVAFVDANSDIRFEQAEAAVGVLARLHARYWKGKGLGSQEWLPRGRSLWDSGAIHSLFELDNWQRSMSLERTQKMNAALRNPAVMQEKMFRLLRSLETDQSCLIHGDAHIGNVAFPKAGGALLYDWQTVMLGMWAHDLSHFICSALSPERRRAWEKNLLKSYLDNLRARVSDAPEWDEAWLLYRRHLLYSYSWVLCPPQWQPESICGPCALRAEAAINDHNVLSLW